MLGEECAEARIGEVGAENPGHAPILAAGAAERILEPDTDSRGLLRIGTYPEGK
ncbi:hypothetical protein GCM10027591_16010 [Zhihengliuella somnathii]